MQNYFERYKKSEVTDTQRIIHTPSDIEKKMFFYIQEAGYLKSLKPHLGKRSCLNSYLFLIVLSGSGTVTYKGNIYEAQTSDCFILDCQNEYSHISNANDPWELLWLHYNGPQAQLYYEYLIHKIGNKFRTKSLGGIVDLIYQLIDVYNSKLDCTDLIVSQIITDIMTQSVTGSLLKSEQATNTISKLRQLLDYIDEHFTESISLDMLAKHFYISKYHLAREFKKEYNQTIIQYILIKRVNYAKELLRFTDLSIGEIAEACGIGDINYFNKIFKRMEMMTASEYRRRW